MNRSAAEELLHLEARGVAMSRNQNYHLFEETGPGRALKLRRRLDYLTRIIQRHHRDTGFAVSIETVAGELPRALNVTLTVLSANLTVRLDDLELRILMRDECVAKVLGHAGASAPVS
jgi:hypothetical protein